MKTKPALRICAHTLAALLAAAQGAHGQTLNVLHSFARDGGGYYPDSGVIAGPNGDLYGTTTSGGASAYGVAYELTPPASPEGAWTETVLHAFGASDGESLVGPLLGPSGALYGATLSNAAGYGTVFQLRPPAGTGAHWKETILHAFTDSDGDGAQPEATPIFGPHGVLYGTTVGGGTNGYGTLYRLAPPNTQGSAWTEATLYSFPGFTGDGSEPSGTLALGSDGSVYGTTQYGGGVGVGTVFQLTPPATSGAAWTETLLHSFEGAGSAFPNGVVMGPGGVLYGTTMGTSGVRACANGDPCGSVFQLTPPAAPGEPWTETTLHTFMGVGDGWLPNSTPVLGPNGVLYGTTTAGGAGSSSGDSVGAIYEMVPPSSPGQAWTEVILYSFPQGGAEGEGPNAVTLGPDGNLYGTTETGGAHNQGTVFQLVLQ